MKKKILHIKKKLGAETVKPAFPAHEAMPNKSFLVCVSTVLCSLEHVL